MKFFGDLDFLILIIVLIIGILGLSLLFSITPNLFLSQLVFFLVGFSAFFVLSRVDFRIYQNLSWLGFFGCLSLLILTFILGEVTRGSIRWVQLGPFTIQTSEIVKPFLISFFAFFFAAEEVKFSKFISGAALFLLPTLLILKQPDLGSTLVIAAAFGGIVFASHFPWKMIFAGITGLMVLFPVFWHFLAGYQKGRILSFINPTLDPLGSGYNLIQAMISVGSGQFFGRGLGKGTQSQLAFLPERHTDFIFASFTEELGFLGAFILLGLYIFLLWRILKIAQNAKYDSAKLFCIGVFSMLLFQIFINVGMNLGIVPIAGVTLPFLSYGGSSILATMICLGMIESIARFQKKQKTLEIG